MPLQSYRCGKCGEKFEIFRSSFYGYYEDERLVCPRCRSTEVEPVVSTLSGAGGGCQGTGNGTCPDKPSG